MISYWTHVMSNIYLQPKKKKGTPQNYPKLYSNYLIQKNQGANQQRDCDANRKISVWINTLFCRIGHRSKASVRGGSVGFHRNHPSVVRRGRSYGKRMRKKPIHMWRLTQKMPETKPKQTTSKEWICKRGNFNDQVIQAVTFFSLYSCRSRL